MTRSLSIRNIFDQVFSTFPFTGLWERAMGRPETNGYWLIWGMEKNGKTWFALMLASMLSAFAKVLYISGEEGTDKAFTEACQRAKLDPSNRNIHFKEYIPLTEIRDRLKKRKGPKIVIIDNITIYADELTRTVMTNLKSEFPDVLFIFLAHEEKGQPYTSAATLCKKLAKIIIHVKGLTGFVSGRCPGGQLTVDEHKSELYWGTEITNV